MTHEDKGAASKGGTPKRTDLTSLRRVGDGLLGLDNGHGRHCLDAANEIERLRASDAAAMQALEETVLAMEIQEGRDSGELRLSAHAFIETWTRALANARSVLAGGKPVLPSSSDAAASAMLGDAATAHVLEAAKRISAFNPLFPAYEEWDDGLTGDARTVAAFLLAKVETSAP